MLFNFPPTRFVTENSQIEQMDHIVSESMEVLDAMAKDESRRRLLEELMDLHHSLETFWRMQDAQEVAEVMTDVMKKNAMRGYY